MKKSSKTILGRVNSSELDAPNDLENGGKCKKYVGASVETCHDTTNSFLDNLRSQLKTEKNTGTKVINGEKKDHAKKTSKKARKARKDMQAEEKNSSSIQLTRILFGGPETPENDKSQLRGNALAGTKLASSSCDRGFWSKLFEKPPEKQKIQFGTMSYAEVASGKSITQKSMKQRTTQKNDVQRVNPENQVPGLAGLVEKTEPQAIPRFVTHIYRKEIRQGCIPESGQFRAYKNVAKPFWEKNDKVKSREAVNPPKSVGQIQKGLQEDTPNSNETNFSPKVKSQTDLEMNTTKQVRKTLISDDQDFRHKTTNCSLIKNRSKKEVKTKSKGDTNMKSTAENGAGSPQDTKARDASKWIPSAPSIDRSPTTPFKGSKNFPRPWYAISSVKGQVKKKTGLVPSILGSSECAKTAITRQDFLAPPKQIHRWGSFQNPAKESILSVGPSSYFTKNTIGKHSKGRYSKHKTTRDLGKSPSCEVEVKEHSTVHDKRLHPKGESQRPSVIDPFKNGSVAKPEPRYSTETRAQHSTPFISQLFDKKKKKFGGNDGRRMDRNAQLRTEPELFWRLLSSPDHL